MDEIDGIGEKRKKALLRAFGSVEGIRDASLEELAHAESMNHAAAKQVWEFFHKDEKRNLKHEDSSESPETGG